MTKASSSEAWIDLKELRMNNGWRQWETAERLGVTRAYISALETGRRSVSLRLMAAIIKTFGVKYEDFYKPRT